MQFFANPQAGPANVYGPAQQAVLGDAGLAVARAEIGSWDGYAPTPLVELPGLARRAGVGRLFYKDEGGRFGLKSFKALGGAYAVFRLLKAEIERRTGDTGVTSRDIAGGAHREIVAGITVTCATDGNHGRSVAWGARTFGCRCVIYIHAHVSEGRRAAIARYGAEVERVAGTYDDSVRHAAEMAAANGWFVVSDTSYPGYMDVPRDVMQGYTVMAAEAAEQLPDGVVPTHVLVQGGVGGMAAAICSDFWQRWGASRPRFVVVEPERADCLYQSARAGRLTPASGDLETMMAGLSCGEVSPLAWEILATGADAFMTVPDSAAIDCMRLLADGDPPVVAGESAVAGLAGLLAAPDEIGIDEGSVVLLFGSEGDTDPELYREIVGRPADAVRAA